MSETQVSRVTSSRTDRPAAEAGWQFARGAAMRKMKLKVFVRMEIRRMGG
jgi:hypothetical protein